MTTPTGYPDWQGYAKWQGAALVSDFNHSYPAGVTVEGPFNALNFRGIYLNHANLAFNHTVTVKWFADVALTQFINSQQYDFHGAESLNVAIEAFAPFFTVETNNTDIAAHNGNLLVAQTNAVNVANEHSMNAHGRKLITINQSVAAGGNAAVHSPAIYSGPAALAVQQGLNANWHAQLQSWNSGNNAYDVLAEIDGATAGRFYVGRVACPRGTMQIQVFNDDAAPQNMIASLVAG